MTYQIDLVRRAEVQMLRDISITTFQETFEGSYSDEDFRDFFESAYSIDTLEQELNNPNSETYFYREHGELLGFFKINIDDAQTEEKGPEYLELQRIYFVKDAQSGGKGTRVFNFVLQRAQELAKSKIWLGVWKHNKQALQFYKKHGFVKTGEHQFITGDTIDLDAVMEKDLTKN